MLEGELGLRIHPEKTRIVHVSQGFEFLGYQVGLGKGLRFRQGGSGLYAIPRQRSVDRFKDQVRALTRRRIAVPLEELIRALNPVIRGWGMYYRRANVRRLFNRLNMWIVRRISGWRFKRWRNAGWRTLPETRLYGEYGLVNPSGKLVPSMRDYYRRKGYTHSESRLRENCMSGSVGRAEAAGFQPAASPDPTAVKSLRIAVGVEPRGGVVLADECDQPKGMESHE